MRSGSKLEVLQVSEESGYTKVRTSKGIEGWLQNQYLSYEPVASLKLITAEKEIARLTTDNKALSSSRNELSGKSSNLSSLVKKLEKENASLTKELNEIKTISSGALKLNEDNLKLTESTQLLKTKIDLLEADNTRLQGDKTKSMWLTGASIAFIGICFGWFFSSRKRKGGSWGNSGL